MKSVFHYLNPEVWRTPQGCLIILAASMPLSFATWMSLLNNFTVEQAAFTGAEIGILQSLREVPGFLAFAAVFLLIFLRERTLALVSLLLLGIGVSITGAFPTVIGLYLTTVLMSIGFHYYETMQMSLTLQWVDKENAPKSMGWQISARSFASLIAYGMVWLALEMLGLDYAWIYAIGGGMTILVILFVMSAFPAYEGAVEQRKELVLRKRYWLFYALTFMGGARRQIFIVFAGFMMVEKFGYDAATITLLYLVNHVVSIWLAPKIGAIISKWGERKALVFEYIGLILVFSGYGGILITGDLSLMALDTPWALVDITAAKVLYVVDHLFFAFAIAQKSYFQKIADPKDVASTAGVSFSINHIAAVFIPALFGIFIWTEAPEAVFLIGAAMAGVSLLLALNVPANPHPGNEVVVGRVAGQPAPAE